MKKRPLDFDDALAKVQYFCAYQERSEKEVRDKMRALGCNTQIIEQVLYALKRDRYVNNKRFAEHYVRSKFNQNQWGRIKIKLGLKQKGIDEVMSEDALQVLDEKHYGAQIDKLLNQKVQRLGVGDNVAKPKVLRYLQSKGYEWHLCLHAWEKHVDQA